MRYPNTRHKVDYIPRNSCSEYQLMYRTDMTSSRDKIYKLEDMYKITAEDGEYYDKVIDAIDNSKPVLFSSVESINHNIWLSRRQTSDIIRTCSPITTMPEEDRFAKPDMFTPSIRGSKPVIPKNLLWERNVILINYLEVERSVEIVKKRLEARS